jgi:3-hydroxyacyl-CoA dehydrogenase
MNHSIRNATVIGAGTMGAGIAVHLANAGVIVSLLDIVPEELTQAEMTKGHSLDDQIVRNRFARDGLRRAGTAKYSGFFTPSYAERVRIGNLDDHFGWIVDSDWVIEAIVEDLPVKQELMKRIESAWRPGTIVTTNTSGLRIADIGRGLSEEFNVHFLGTHFFNPPRVMRLLEIIPGPKTDPEIVEFMVRYCEEILGKGVVVCKDTPNFIANRVVSLNWTPSHSPLPACRSYWIGCVRKGYC